MSRNPDCPVFAKTTSVLLLLLVSLACSHKADPAGSEDALPPLDAQKYMGAYVIEPSAKMEQLTLQPGGVVRYVSSDSPGGLMGTYRLDRRVLRVFMEGTEPMGVFLTGAFDTEAWRGRWKNQSRSLKKLSVPTP